MGARHGRRAGSNPVNATDCRDVAFDTVIMVKQTPRRMLAAVQEVCGGRVLIPDETAREAGKVYVRIAASQARRETQWKATEQWGADWSGGQRESVKRHTLDRTREKVAGFRRWLDEEVGRNDGPYRLAAGSAQADLLAQEIAAEAFLDERDPGRTPARFQGGPCPLASSVRDEASPETGISRRSPGVAHRAWSRRFGTPGRSP